MPSDNPAVGAVIAALIEDGRDAALERYDRVATTEGKRAVVRELLRIVDEAAALTDETSSELYRLSSDH